MRILIADDHELLRDTLVLYLQGEAGFEVALGGGRWAVQIDGEGGEIINN